MATSEPSPSTDQRGRHADPADDPPPEDEAPPQRARRFRPAGGTPVGRHPAANPLLLASGLLLGLFLAPAILDRLDFSVTDRAAAVARSAATRWPGDGEPWFWPSWVALLAGIVAVVVIALAFARVRLPDLVVGALAAVLALATARAAWATLDVVNARIWDLLTVCAICLTAFALAVSAVAHWRSPSDEGKQGKEEKVAGSGGGAAGVASAAVGGFGLALLLLLGGATVGHVQAEGLGPAGPPQDVAGLLSIRAADAAVAADLPGAWVPQVAAAPIGDDTAATGYSVQHRAWTARQPVLLVRGDDLPGAGLDEAWWLTLAALPFGSEAEAQQWCAGAGMAPPACVPRKLPG
ncbi:hypothetical protein SAMN05660748_3080 [Blastococcus aggregatus]|uniref:Uncharacterized protein n=1 Tax=Blastococcus aggregatus TaxID=38502 RepID=A0A285V8I3_9ACTN|nr:hypothetical protein [Blastococcus aggregatus]SOC50333.1 hypothetical protein SAMN05660748_3080 [Blastococcus aggregatus]